MYIVEHACYAKCTIPYSRKYWQSLSLAVWPQTDYIKMSAEFKFGGGISGPFIKESCRLLLRHLNKPMSLQIYKKKKQTWQHASVELAAYTSCIEGRECYCMDNVITHNIGGF